MVRLDKVNLMVLDRLQRDGRESISDLARHVNRSESTVRERLASLEAAGYIKGYRVLIDWPKVGRHVHAFVRADVTMNAIAQLGERLAAVPQVVSATLTSGPKPLLVELLADNLDELSRILEHRLSVLGLESMEVRIGVRPLVEPRAINLSGSVVEPAVGATPRASPEEVVPELKTGLPR